MSLSFTQSPTQTQLQQQQQLQIPIKRLCVVENCENFLCGLDGARLGLDGSAPAWLGLPRLGVLLTTSGMQTFSCIKK